MQIISTLIENYTFLISNEWQVDELSFQQKHFLFEIIERRYTDKSTTLCIKYHIEDWHDHLGGKIHTAAIIDRIVNNAIHVFSCDLNMRRTMFPTDDTAIDNSI